MIKWISVDERLPDKYSNVVFRFLGTDLLRGLEGNAVGHRIGYYRDGFRVDGQDSMKYTTTTHWIYMPPEPEVENND